MRRRQQWCAAEQHERADHPRADQPRAMDLAVHKDPEQAPARMPSQHRKPGSKNPQVLDRQDRHACCGCGFSRDEDAALRDRVAHREAERRLHGVDRGDVAEVPEHAGQHPRQQARPASHRGASVFDQMLDHSCDHSWCQRMRGLCISLATVTSAMEPARHRQRLCGSRSPQVQAGQPVAAADRDERADGDEDQRDGDDEDAERHREDRRGRA